MKTLKVCSFCLALLAVFACLRCSAGEATNNAPVSVSTNHVSAVPALNETYTVSHYQVNPPVEFHPMTHGFSATFGEGSMYSKKSRQIMDEMFNKDSGDIILFGHAFLTTQGPVSPSFNPLETEADRELKFEEHRRVEIPYTDKTLFWSEAEGIGFHSNVIAKGIGLPANAISPNAAFFVKASDNSIAMKFSFPF